MSPAKHDTSHKRHNTTQSGRPPKFSAPVIQKSVHLKAEQVDWVRRFAALRSAQEGVGISESDVVRLALESFITQHAEEVPITA